MEQIAILGVRYVTKNTNSATTLKSSPAQFVLFDMPLLLDRLVGFKHVNRRCAELAPYVVRHRTWCATFTRVEYFIARGSAPRFHPSKNSHRWGRRAFRHIGNIQNRLLKPLSGKGSPKNSATGSDALTVHGTVHDVLDFYFGLPYIGDLMCIQ